MTAPRPRSRQPKQLDPGILQAEINSFALRLAAEGKAAKTIRTYAEAVQWFAATGLSGRSGLGSWEQVSSRDVQRWMAWLLGRYSAAYASNQYRALQQFFKWLAAEDQLPDPMAGLAPPRVTGRLVPVFAPGELTPAGAGVRGPQLRPAPRYRDHRGAHRDRHPAVRAGRTAIR
jgi:integrase/recombinase XerD